MLTLLYLQSEMYSLSVSFQSNTAFWDKFLIDLPYVELDDRSAHRWIYGYLSGQEELMFLYEWIA